MRYMLITFVALLLSPLARAADKPNILFLFADDFSYEAMGSLGVTDVETPNLDRLAKRGTHFTHAYNMGSWSGAVCVASRNMLLTGRSVWRARDVAKDTESLRKNGLLWPGLLKTGGYHTYMSGKWHIQANAQRSFDTVRHVRPGMPKTVDASYNRPLEGQKDNWDAADSSNGGFWEGGKHWTEVAADDAIDFIGEAKKSTDPFFMYIAFNAPHDPRQAPQSFLDKYPLDRMEVPRNYLPEYPYKDAIGCGQELRDERLGPFPRTHYAVKTHRREYYALITHLDQQIGRILDALQESGKEDATWIFFTADHGLAVGHHGLFGKQNMYDHSLRVPFLVVGPGVMTGVKNDTPIYLQDAMATSLELAGVTKPDFCDFRSLVGLSQGKKGESPRKSIYGGYLQLQRSVVMNGWKLILYPNAKVARLYNLTNDPQELHDLAGEVSSKEKQLELFKELRRLQSEFDDTLDLEKVFPELL